jgi:hypothetical protein
MLKTLGIVALTFSLAACGGDDHQQQSSATPSPEPSASQAADQPDQNGAPDGYTWVQDKTPCDDHSGVKSYAESQGQDDMIVCGDGSLFELEKNQ